MGWKGWTALALLLAVGGLAWSGALDGLVAAEDERPVVAGEVERGRLEINVVSRGNMKAANSTELESEVEGSSTILYLIEEGTVVEAGTLVAELDATSMVEKRVSQEITVQNAEASWIKATQNLEIQKSKNESDLAAAERTLAFAELDKKKYLQGDWLSQEQQARDDILIEEEELKRADDKLFHSKGLFDKGFLTRTEYEADELAKKRREIALEQAKLALDVLLEYTHPRRVEELEADIIEATRELERVNLEATARLVDFEAELRSSKARFDLETEKFERLDDQIAKARIYAPVAGMVVHAQPEGGRWSQGEPLREGSSVRERQDLITIPSSEGMIAEVSLHESVLEKVRVGMPCTITVDALPGVQLPGEVRFKAVLPDKNSWMANPNQRLYRTEVQIDAGDPRLRPGMSCSIEIHVETLEDATYVPIQAVFRDGQDQVVFVVQGAGGYERRVVEVGSFNHLWAQTLSGVTEGERVAMSLPDGISLQASSSQDERVERPGGPPGAGEGSRPGGTEGTSSGAPGGASGERPAGGGSWPGATGGGTGGGKPAGVGRPAGSSKPNTKGSGAPGGATESAEDAPEAGAADAVPAADAEAASHGG